MKFEALRENCPAEQVLLPEYTVTGCKSCEECVWQHSITLDDGVFPDDIDGDYL